MILSLNYFELKRIIQDINDILFKGKMLIILTVHYINKEVYGFWLNWKADLLQVSKIRIANELIKKKQFKIWITFLFLAFQFDNMSNIIIKNETKKQNKNSFRYNVNLRSALTELQSLIRFKGYKHVSMYYGNCMS